MNSSEGLCLHDSFGSRRAASVASVRSEAAAASEPISVGSELIPPLHKAELFSNAAGSSMISYLWKEKKYTAAVSERSKKMWEKQPCRHQGERRRRGEGAPGPGSVSPAVHGRPYQTKHPHSSLQGTSFLLSGKPGNLAARQFYPLQIFKSKGKFSVLNNHSNKLSMFFCMCGYNYQEKHLLCVLKHGKIN